MNLIAMSFYEGNPDVAWYELDSNTGYLVVELQSEDDPMLSELGTVEHLETIEQVIESIKSSGNCVYVPPYAKLKTKLKKLGVKVFDEPDESQEAGEGEEEEKEED